jgi:hypothetical protein
VRAPLVHIGYQKTATTWFQLHLFTRHDLGFSPAASEEALKQRIVKPHDLGFNAATARERLTGPRSRSVEQGLVPVFSAERLSGDPHLGGRDSASIAARLAATFPQAKVLMVIREQQAIILSMYKQYVSAGGLLGLRAYLEDGRGLMNWPFTFGRFAYDRLILRYHELFGADNVLVLPFELFRSTPRDFVARIVRFTGASAAEGSLDELPYGAVEHASPRAAAVVLRRRLNRVLRRPLTPWGRIDSKGRLGEALRDTSRGVGDHAPAWLNDALERRMRQIIARAVAGRYEDSNAATASLIGVDLRPHGYALPAADAAPIATLAVAAAGSAAAS